MHAKMAMQSYKDAVAKKALNYYGLPPVNACVNLKKSIDHENGEPIQLASSDPICTDILESLQPEQEELQNLADAAHDHHHHGVAVFLIGLAQPASEPDVD